MTKIRRQQTLTGQVIHFDPAGPVTVPADDWTHEGATPSISLSARGAHVQRLVNALNGWWDCCHGRSVEVDKSAADGQ